MSFERLRTGSVELETLIIGTTPRGRCSDDVIWNGAGAKERVSSIALLCVFDRVDGGDPGGDSMYHFLLTSGVVGLVVPDLELPKYPLLNDEFEALSLLSIMDGTLRKVGALTGAC